MYFCYKQECQNVSSNVHVYECLCVWMTPAGQKAIYVHGWKCVYGCTLTCIQRHWGKNMQECHSYRLYGGWYVHIHTFHKITQNLVTNHSLPFTEVHFQSVISADGGLGSCAVPT